MELYQRHTSRTLVHDSGSTRPQSLYRFLSLRKRRKKIVILFIYFWEKTEPFLIYGMSPLDRSYNKRWRTLTKGPTTISINRALQYRHSTVHEHKTKSTSSVQAYARHLAEPHNPQKHTSSTAPSFPISRTTSPQLISYSEFTRVLHTKNKNNTYSL